MNWGSSEISEYHKYTKAYISGYNSKIDCADLAISALIDFAAEKSLPVKLKYYAKGWKWFEFDPKESNSSEFKKLAMRQLGALNVIDNTKPIPIFSAKPGDLIMSRWSSTSGHTRIIYSVTQTKDNKFNVVWYQGNLPAIIPQKKTSMFSNISGVHESKPRRWNFEQFNT